MTNTPDTQTISLFKYYASVEPLTNVFPYFADTKVSIKNITSTTDKKFVFINPGNPMVNPCIYVEDTCSAYNNPLLSNNESNCTYTIKYIDNNCNIQLKSDNSVNLITITIYKGNEKNGCGYYFLNLDKTETLPYRSQFSITGISFGGKTFSVKPDYLVFQFSGIYDAINKWYHTKDSSVYVNKCCMPFVKGVNIDFVNSYCTTLKYDDTKVPTEACMSFYTEYCKSKDGTTDVTCACDDNFQDDKTDHSVIAREAIISKGLTIPRSCIIDQCEKPEAFKFNFDEGTCPNICLNAINIIGNKDNIIDLNNVRMQMTCDGPNGGIKITDDPDTNNPNNPNNPNSSKLWLIILCIFIIIIIFIVAICKYFKFF